MLIYLFIINFLLLSIQTFDSMEYKFKIRSGRRGHNRMQSVHITTKVVNSNSAHCELYLIEHCVIKLVVDLRQVGGFLRVLRFLQLIKLTATL
jgi:hypothetical protein